MFVGGVGGGERKINKQVEQTGHLRVMCAVEKTEAEEGLVPQDGVGGGNVKWSRQGRSY